MKTNVVKIGAQTPVQKRDALRDRLAKIDLDLVALQAQHFNEGAANDGAEREQVARSYLNGENVVFDVVGIEGRMRALRAERVVIEDAMRLAREDIAKDNRRAEKEKRENAMPAYRRAVADLVRALGEVAEANERIAQLRLVAGSLPVACYPNVGDPTNKESPAGWFLAYLRRVGLLDDRAIASAAE